MFKYAFAGFAADGERFGEQLVEEVARRFFFETGEPAAELGRLGLQFGIRERGDLGFELVRRHDGPPQAHDLAFVTVEKCLQEGHSCI